MKPSKPYAFLLLFSFLGQMNLHATFSIIAVDPVTKEIGSAGATCVVGIRDVGGVIILNDIIPGRGGVNAQAWICVDPHVNLELAMDQLRSGASAEETRDWLLENDGCDFRNFNPEERQYGILKIADDGSIQVAAHTGKTTLDWAGHITGPNYSIQGNILLGPEVLQSMEKAFLETEGALADKLMAAMQGAKRAGADSRCSDYGTSSTSTFLRVVRPNDTMEDPYLELNVRELRRRLEPIDELQSLFNEWKASIQPQWVQPRLDYIVQDDLRSMKLQWTEASIVPLPGKQIIPTYQLERTTKTSPDPAEWQWAVYGDNVSDRAIGLSSRTYEVTIPVPKGTVKNIFRLRQQLSLSGLDLTGADFRRADLRGNKMDPSRTGGHMDDPAVYKTHFTGADLSFADLSFGDFSTADFTGANLSDARLIGVNFAKRSQIFIGSIVWDAALLKDVNFSGADLTDANLKGVDVSGVNFSGANLTRTIFPDDLGENPEKLGIMEKWLLGWRISNAPAPGQNGWSPWILPEVNLSGVYMHSAHLKDSNFSQGNMSHSRLSGVHFENTKLQGTDFRDTEFIGVRFSDSDLSGADFSNATFDAIPGSHTHGIPVRFSNVNLSGVSFLGATGWENVVIDGAIFSETILSNGTIRTDDLPEN